jgi:hypothetical protein
MPFVFATEEALHAAPLVSGIGASSSLLLLLMMTFPMVLSLLYVKALLFALLLFLVAFGYASGHSQLNYSVGLWAVGLAAISFLFVIKGFFAATPGAAKMAALFIFWPLAYTFWISGVTKWHIVRSLHRAAIISTLLIGLYGSLYLLTQLKLLPETGLVSALSLGWDEESFNTHEGYTGMAIAGMNSLPFLLPYVMASLAIPTSWLGHGRLWRTTIWVGCGLSCFTVLAAGRRALFLVVLLSPMLILLFRSFQPAAERSGSRRSMTRFAVAFIASIAIIFFSLTLVYDFDLRLLWDRFVTGFDLSAQTVDAGGTERRQQLIALSNGWLNRPFWGAGLGASALGSIRSETMPWSYELYYLSLLYQTGIVGFVAYAGGIAWIFRQGIKIIREGGELGRLMIPMLVGCAGFLIATATNPYLDRFDGLWVLFLPLAIVNYRRSVVPRMNGQT